MNEKLKVSQWIRVAAAVIIYFGTTELMLLRLPVDYFLLGLVEAGVISLTLANSAYMLALYMWITIPGVILVFFKLRSSARQLSKTWYWIGIGWFISMAAALLSGMIVSMFTTDQSANQSMLNEAMRIAPVLTILPIIFGGPIIEEIIFRYALQDVFFGGFFDLIFHKLFKLNPDSKGYRIVKAGITIFAAAILFGLIHVIGEGKGDYIYLITYGAAGIALGLIYQFSNKNLIVAMGAHMLYNITSVLLTLLMGIA